MGSLTKLELIQAAYSAIGYRDTNDNLVINDRNTALSKLSDSELLAIIQNKK